MKKIVAALLSSWCGCALAQTAQELIDNGKNSENVTTFGMGYHLNQYSPLSQINKSNVKRLVPIWSTSLSNDAGELAQPTIYNGVMYVVNGHWTFASTLQLGSKSGGRRSNMSGGRRGLVNPASSCAGERPSMMASFFARRLIVMSSRST